MLPADDPRNEELRGRNEMSLYIDSGEEDSPAALFGVTGSFYGNRGNGKRNDGGVGGRDGYGLDAKNNDNSFSSESSSIGVAGESSASLGSSSSTVGVQEDEVESKIRGDSSGSIDSLEDALPIKRGLSIFFNGKSKSFTTLSDVVTAPLTASDLAKPENPFNKRRRILMANKYQWPRRASCGSLSTVASSSSSSSLPPLPPVLNCSNLFSLVEDEEVEDERDEESSPSQTPLGPPPSFYGRKFKDSFRSPGSFSLSDLQQHANQFSEP